MAKQTTKQAKKETPSAIVAKGAANLPAEVANAAAWGSQELSSRDLVIPKILAMQGLSKLVVAGEAKFGELRESLSNKVLGSDKQPLEFIPFHRTVEFVVMQKDGDIFKFNRVEPITPENDATPFEVETEDGEVERWYRTQNFYVLRPDEVASGTAYPYVISFRSTSARAGAKLTTTMYVKNLKANLTPASTVMELVAEKKTNDKGTFIVLDVREKRRASDAEVKEAFSWNQIAQSGRAKVDHSDLETPAQSDDSTEVSNEY